MRKAPPDTQLVEELASKLYDAVGSATGLMSVMSDVRRALDATTFVLFLLPSPTRHVLTHYLVEGVTQRAVVEYQNHFFEYDPWLRAIRESGLPPLQWWCGHELVPPEHLASSYFGREFLAPQGIHDVLSGFVDVADEHGEAIMAMSFHRGCEQGLFDARSKSIIGSLVPHFRRAMRMHLRLAPKLAIGSSLHAMFAESHAPMFFVNSDGELLEANLAALELLRTDREKSLLAVDPAVVNRASALSARAFDGWRSFSELLSPLKTQPTSSLKVSLSDPDGSSKRLTIRRVHGVGGADICAQPTFAVCMIERQTPCEAYSQIALRFGLTPSEAETLRMLGDGKSPDQIALSRGVRISTVRSQLASSFSKTGTRRQTELLALVTKLPAE